MMAVKYRAKNQKRFNEKMSSYKKKRGCQNCGYKEYPAILIFHHPNHDNKGIIGRGYNWKIVLKEMKRCKLLCPNCHAIIHLKQNEGKRTGRGFGIIN